MACTPVCKLEQLKRIAVKALANERGDNHKVRLFHLEKTRRGSPPLLGSLLLPSIFFILVAEPCHSFFHTFYTFTI